MLHVAPADCMQERLRAGLFTFKNLDRQLSVCGFRKVGHQPIDSERAVDPAPQAGRALLRGGSRFVQIVDRVKEEQAGRCIVAVDHLNASGKHHVVFAHRRFRRRSTGGAVADIATERTGVFFPRVPSG